MTTIQQDVDGIPALLVGDERSSRPLVLWMTHLGGSARKELPTLEAFAAAGHPVVSFDPPGHGARGQADPWEMAADVLAHFRRRMWPLRDLADPQTLVDQGTPDPAGSWYAERLDPARHADTFPAIRSRSSSAVTTTTYRRTTRERSATGSCTGTPGSSS